MSTGLATHLIVLPGGGFSQHALNEAEPIVDWLTGIGVRASVFRYPLLVSHPAPLDALRAEIRRLRESAVERIGLIGFSAGGHLAGLAALAPGANASEAVDFVVLGYAITSMETESYRPARLILLGENATPELRRATSLDALVTSSAPPFFLWHTAEDPYVPAEHTYRLASSLAIPAPPFTRTTAPTPKRTRSSWLPNVASSASRPRAISPGNAASCMTPVYAGTSARMSRRAK